MGQKPVGDRGRLHPVDLEDFLAKSRWFDAASICLGRGVVCRSPQDLEESLLPDHSVVVVSEGSRTFPEGHDDKPPPAEPQRTLVMVRSTDKKLWRRVAEVPFARVMCCDTFRPKTPKWSPVDPSMAMLKRLTAALSPERPWSESVREVRILNRMDVGLSFSHQCGHRTDLKRLYVYLRRMTVLWLPFCMVFYMLADFRGPLRELHIVDLAFAHREEFHNHSGLEMWSRLPPTLGHLWLHLSLSCHWRMAVADDDDGPPFTARRDWWLANRSWYYWYPLPGSPGDRLHETYEPQWDSSSPVPNVAAFRPNLPAFYPATRLHIVLELDPKLQELSGTAAATMREFFENNELRLLVTQLKHLGSHFQQPVERRMENPTGIPGAAYWEGKVDELWAWA